MLYLSSFSSIGDVEDVTGTSDCDSVENSVTSVERIRDASRIDGRCNVNKIDLK